MSKYYITKEGVFCQGVHWIGDNLEEAKTIANILADKDVDTYHTWEVNRYHGLSNTDDCIYWAQKERPHE